MSILASGIPKIKDYESVLASPLYKEMLQFSDEFSKRHEQDLSYFQKFWVKDPLRQWSRSWEYPYVFQCLTQKMKAGASVVDAGSGLTFFPFFVAKKLNCQVICVDTQAEFLNPMHSISKREGLEVSYLQNDIRRIDLPDKSQAALYCISVLEHTQNYEEIIKEFRRCLKPTAPLIVTFDICPSGVADIDLKKSKDLVNSLNPLNFYRYIEEIDRLPEEYSEVISTNYAKTHRPQSLPWRWPHLSAFKAGVKSRKLKTFIDLTFCCVSSEN